MAETGCPHALVKTVPLRADGWQGPSATWQPSTSDGPVTNDRTDRFDGPSPGIVGSGDFVAGSASPATRRCPPMPAATSATKATDPTEAPRSCGGLGHTSTCRGTRAMSRRRCRGSRALADDRTHATESTEPTIHPLICRFWQLRQAPANTSRDGTNLVWTTSTPAAGCLTRARTPPKRRLGYRAWARAEVRRLRWRVG